MSSWIPAATAYSSHNLQMIPFYIYYSMFGFQRIGDLAWAAADMQARGFLLGGTAGRTTLAGEGLQHQDGHSHLLSAAIPNCISYDPTFAYELAVLIHHGMERMFKAQDNVFYYLTIMNENYEHPAMPVGIEDNIIKGMYLFRESEGASLQLMGSGAILREVIAASEMLLSDFGIKTNIWSVTSFSELSREGQECSRWNNLHPLEAPKPSFVEKQLMHYEGPCVAATDYVRNHAEQIREFIPNAYYVLGTDGFGRSDTRESLRAYFEVNKYYIAVTALNALAKGGKIEAGLVVEAINKYQIDPEKPHPMTQ